MPERQTADVATDLGLLAVASIWGVNFVVIKVGLESLAPLAFNALRFPLACAALLVALRIRRRPLLPRREDVPMLVGLGLLGNLVYQCMFIVGLDRTLAGNASIILATTPVWAAALSQRLGHERLGTGMWLGVLGTLTGMVLVVAGSASDVSVGTDTLAGDLLMIGSAVGWAAYTVLSRPLVLRYGPVPVTAWTLWIATPGLLLIGLPSLARTSFGDIPAGAWGALVYAGLLALAVAYVAWARGVERLGSARTAVYSNLVPIVALITAFVWLGEAPSALQLLGAAVIIGSLTLARLAGRPLMPPIPAASGASARGTRRGSAPRS